MARTRTVGLPQEETPGGAVDASGRAPRPFEPRISARRSYRLHKVLDRNPAWMRLAGVLSSSSRVYDSFTAVEDRSKTALYGCRMCGQCALPLTGYACPMTCPKQLRNGPCGGVGTDGSCEVYPELRCVWVQAYERAEASGHVGDLELIHRPVDKRRFGQSSWVNFWSGRDLDMAVRPVGGLVPDIRVAALDE